MNYVENGHGLVLWPRDWLPQLAYMATIEQAIPYPFLYVQDGEVSTSSSYA